MAPIPGNLFGKVMDAEERRRRGKPLTAEEEELLNIYGHNFEPKRCPRCDGPLGPRVDGERETMDGEEVCDDCYWQAFGDELEKHPIGPPGLMRRSY